MKHIKKLPGLLLGLALLGCQFGMAQPIQLSEKYKQRELKAPENVRTLLLNQRKQMTE